MTKKNTIVGLTMGDINGVGIEVILKSLSDERILEQITPVVYGSSIAVDYYKNLIDSFPIKINVLKTIDTLAHNKLNLINIIKVDISIKPGENLTKAGEYALESLEAATTDLAAGKIDVLVTAPINKKNIQAENFSFPGHTEYLTSLSNVDDSLMLMVKEGLRVGLATNHLPLSEVSKSIDQVTIIKKLKLLNNSLIKDFCVSHPKIAVLGLNPHAGDLGLLGTEEEEIIIPAINTVKKDNILAFGPYSADGFFGSGNFKEFDGILAMYHDQGLVPFKTLAAGTGVNFTAGLPIVRTSPDHGTAYNIAGKNIASFNSFRNAIYLAVDIHKNRSSNKSVLSDPLIVNDINA